MPTIKLSCEACHRAAEPSSWSVIDGTLRLTCAGCGTVAELAPRAGRSPVPVRPPVAVGAPRPAPGPTASLTPPILRPSVELAPARGMPVADRTPAGGVALPAPDPTPAPEATPAGNWLEEGWDRLRDRWTDDEAHNRLISEAAARNAFAELGTRYRRVLEGHPEDSHALRARDELVRKASAQLLTNLPREERGIGPAQARTIRNVLLGIFLLGVVAFGAYVLLQMGRR